MTPEEIKKEILDKIGLYKMYSKLVSLEVINWLNDLVKRIDEKKPEPVEKEVKVELKEEKTEEKTASKTKGKGKWK